MDWIVTGPQKLEKFAGSEVADEAAVGGEEFVVGEFFELDPLELMEDLVLQLALKRGHGEELQIDCASMAVVVADVRDARSDFGGDAEFFLEFAGESLLGAFALLDLAAGKLPLEGHWLVGAALANEDKTFANQQTCDYKT
jgi:hypothetical protein